MKTLTLENGETIKIVGQKRSLLVVTNLGGDIVTKTDYNREEEQEEDEKIAYIKRKLFYLNQEEAKIKQQMGKELAIIQDAQKALWEERKKITRAKITFSDEQIKAMVSRMSKSKDVRFYFDEDSEDQECEDDGFLHVRRAGIRFVKEGRESELPAFVKRVEAVIREETP